ncbi:MAG: SRPBCC family protein [Erythrobacter sp.]|uniref:SRPBCC family protein n=1 Tax=Erythrobacter sp. TaxID=1042 RepID=UPI003C77D742
MTRPVLAFSALLCTLSATPAAADVVRTGEDRFVTRAEAVVSADTKATWLALISPARWWSDEHTWSGDAANLTLTPQAGGCFCETIPEVEDAERITLEGSVEHMRIVQAYPENALRMIGALGPLQSEPVTGVLTIALTEAEEGTRIVWEYNVGGAMRYETAAIAQAVDNVMTEQLVRLADELGMVSGPTMPGTDGGETDAGQPDEDDAQADESPADDNSGATSGPSVEEAFEDLSDG